LSVEVDPVGVACNLTCRYCYQQPMREAGNLAQGYDLTAMKRGLEKENWRFSLFGGEALLMPIADLEELFRFGREKFQHAAIQTNGTLITDAHLALFKQYAVSVGISIDGPDELNDARWAGSLEKTRAATTRTLDAIQRLANDGRPPSLILTLHRLNASDGPRERLKTWLRELDHLGVSSVRLHLLEVNGLGADLALSADENVRALVALMEFQDALPKLRFDLFPEMVRLLLGTDQWKHGSESCGVGCIWNACDPLTTDAVHGINAIGERSNCQRTNKDGIEWQKADQSGCERQLALFRSPVAEGGCGGCRFFVCCKGHCPGNAEGGDWRNKTVYCRVWSALFAVLEAKLMALGKAPVSRLPELPAIEAAMVAGWERGHRLSVAQALAVARGAPMPDAPGGNQAHGDHWDAPDGYAHDDAGVTVHGDQGTTIMHGDSHGDSDAT